MFEKLKTLLQNKKGKPKKISRPSRELKTIAERETIIKPPVSSRDSATTSPWIVNFQSFRNMLKDFSKRIESIKENPEEAYLINTEISFRLLGVLENLVHLAEKNTAVLEKLDFQNPIIRDDMKDSDKRRRAREVLAVLENRGALTYEELRKELKPQISYKRVTALVSEMIRDGIPLKREGKPVRVILGDP
jgi:hypothetical protein